MSSEGNWLTRIFSAEAAADREDERKKKAQRREQRQADAEAKRKLKLEKQAAKNRRYDAITEARKKRGGAGLTVVLAHKEEPKRGKGRRGKKPLRSDSREAVDAMKRNIRRNYTGSMEARNRAYAADVDASQARPVRDLPEYKRKDAVADATLMQTAGLSQVYNDDQYQWMYDHGMAKHKLSEIDRDSAEYAAVIDRYNELTATAGYEIYREAQGPKRAVKRKR